MKTLFLSTAVLAFVSSTAVLAADGVPAPSAQAEVRPLANGAKTRAQVRAETLEARRIAPLSQGEHYRFYTPEELQRIEQAGLRARAMPMAAS